jgi:hypothetical protein
MEENTQKPVLPRVTIVVLSALVVLGIGYYFMTKKTNSYQASAESAVSSATVAPQKQLFKDSSMFQYAYQIFPGPISDQTKNAMAGFMTTSKTLPDGSTQITMTATNPEYKNQQYSVKPGYVLYFIEKSPGDDSASENTDRYLPDDTAVLVDPQGYAVN